jgi:acyl-CoA synthetase (AMP-forming)/AMP-acid ligase II
MVLVDKQESGDQQLIAYIQLDLGDSQTVSDIKDSLKLELPKYMIPDLIHLNQELPINKNGKIDGSRIRQINAQTQASVA